MLLVVLLLLLLMLLLLPLWSFDTCCVSLKTELKTIR